MDCCWAFTSVTWTPRSLPLGDRNADQFRCVLHTPVSVPGRLCFQVLCLRGGRSHVSSPGRWDALRHPLCSADTRPPPSGGSDGACGWDTRSGSTR